MFTKHIQALALLPILLLDAAHAYRLTFYSGSGCRGQRLGSMLQGQTRDQCKRDYYGNAGSVQISHTGTVDDNYMVVLFNSDDCNPENEVQHGDETDGCLDKPYKGFQVWDMSDVP